MDPVTSQSPVIDSLPEEPAAVPNVTMPQPQAAGVAIRVAEAVPAAQAPSWGFGFLRSAYTMASGAVSRLGRAGPVTSEQPNASSSTSSSTSNQALPPPPLTTSILSPFYGYNPRPRIEEQRKSLTERMGSDVWAGLCHVTAQYARDFVTHTLDSIQKGETSERNAFVDFFLNESGQIRFLRGTLLNVGKSQMGIIGEAIELNVLKAMNVLTARFDALQAAEPQAEGPLAHVIALASLDEASTHLQHIVDAQQHVNESATDDVYLTAMQTNLHPAVAYAGQPAEREAQRLSYFGQEVAKNILKVAFPNGARDLDVPSTLQSTTWWLLESQIFPTLILSGIEKLNDSGMINSALILMLESYRPHLPENEVAPAGSPPPPDLLQQRYNEVGSRLVGQVIKATSPGTHYLLSFKPSIEQAMGADLGATLRTFVDSLDKARISGFAKSLLENWLSRESRLGNMQLQSSPQVVADIVLQFPQTIEEKAILARRLEEEKQQLETKATTLLKTTIERMVTDIPSRVEDTLSRGLKSAERATNAYLEGLFGDIAASIVSVFHKITNFVFITCFGLLADFVAKPLVKGAVNLFSYRIDSCSQRLLRLIRRPIHENFYFRAAERNIALLNRTE